MSWSISGEQVLELSSVWWVGHDDDMRNEVVKVKWGILERKWYEEEEEGLKKYEIRGRGIPNRKSDLRP